MDEPKVGEVVTVTRVWMTGDSIPAGWALAARSEPETKIVHAGYADPGTYMVNARSEPGAEGLRAEVARLWAALGYEYPNPVLAATPAADSRGLDVASERLADWMMFHVPEYNQWMMIGWRETMRDEAVVLARSMLDAALTDPDPAPDAGDFVWVHNGSGGIRLDGTPNVIDE